MQARLENRLCLTKVTLDTLTTNNKLWFLYHRLNRNCKILVLVEGQNRSAWRSALEVWSITKKKKNSIHLLCSHTDGSKTVAQSCCPCFSFAALPEKGKSVSRLHVSVFRKPLTLAESLLV